MSQNHVWIAFGDIHENYAPFDSIPELAEAEGIIALYGNFFNKFTHQFRIGAVEEIRPILQQGYQLPRLLGGGILLGIHQLFFVQLGLPELTGQLVAFGYKNVRINEAVLLEKGQRLILTGEFGYFFVEGNDVLAPEQSPITDRLEGFKHLLQTGEALMLELIVEAAEGFIRLRFRHGLDGAVAFFIVPAAAPVPSAIDLLCPDAGAAGAAHLDAEPFMSDGLSDAASLPQFFCAVE